MAAVPESSDSTQTNVDTLISPRWLIPVVPEDQVLTDHSIVVDGGRIVDLLPTPEALDRYRPERQVELKTHVLIPGLVNAHGHAAMSLLRGYAEDCPLEEWLERYIWPTEARWVDYDFVRDGTLLAITEMLLGGTTCFSDLYLFPDGAAEAIHRAGIRAQICFPIVQFPSAWARDEDEYLHKGLQLHDDHRTSALISTAFGPHSPYAVSDGTLKRVVTFAEELQIPIQLHLHETAKEVADSVAATGIRPLEQLRRLGMVSPLLQAVHMTQLETDEIELLAENSVSVIHCPESNAKLASGICPVASLAAAGVNVALGTDGAASNNDLDMLGEMKSAALLAKAFAGDATVLDAHSALEMATLGGAKAMGLEDTIGSLEIGKLADIAAIDLGDVVAQPVYNPLAQLVHTACGERVTHVWVNGEPLLTERRLVGIDQAEVLAATTTWMQKIGAEP